MFNFLKKGEEHFTYKCSIIGSGMNKSGLGYSIMYSDDEINPQTAKKQAFYLYKYHTLPETIKSSPVLAILPRCNLNGWNKYVLVNPSMVFISLETLYDAAKKESNTDCTIPTFKDVANRKWKIAIYTGTASKIVVEPGYFTLSDTNQKLYDFNLNDSNVKEIIAEIAKTDVLELGGNKRKCGLYGTKFCLVPNDTNGFTINIDQYGIVKGIN
jgi:hypothetical protein